MKSWKVTATDQQTGNSKALNPLRKTDKCSEGWVDDPDGEQSGVSRLNRLQKGRV